MGGHAVRHYGVSRDTFDFDFHLSTEVSAELPERLRESGLFGNSLPTELPTWRGTDFRRFVLGKLPDGKDEYLEFWFRGHLLPPFEQLFARREEGEVHGIQLPFLSLPDLIRSKETERESDWLDVALLEEILDARNLARCFQAKEIVAALANLRSMRGFRTAHNRGLLGDRSIVSQALGIASNPISRSILIPFASATRPENAEGIPDFMIDALRKVTPGTMRHLAVVEALRRIYRQNAMAVDRVDKQISRQAP